MLFCPCCTWEVYQNSEDPHMLPIGRVIKYAVEHGHPMPRYNERYKNVYCLILQKCIPYKVITANANNNKNTGFIKRSDHLVGYFFIDFGAY